MSLVDHSRSDIKLPPFLYAYWSPSKKSKSRDSAATCIVIRIGIDNVMTWIAVEISHDLRFQGWERNQREVKRVKNRIEWRFPVLVTQRGDTITWHHVVTYRRGRVWVPNFELEFRPFRIAGLERSSCRYPESCPRPAWPGICRDGQSRWSRWCNGCSPSPPQSYRPQHNCSGSLWTGFMENSWSSTIGISAKCHQLCRIENGLVQTIYWYAFTMKPSVFVPKWIGKWLLDTLLFSVCVVGFSVFVA